jgi:hypothetical protein
MRRTRSRLESLRLKRLKIAAQLKTLAEKETRIRADREVNSNPDWKSLQESIKTIKYKLQIIRVNIKRKQFSIASRLAAVKTISESLKKFQREEQAEARALRELDAKAKSMREAAIKSVETRQR